MRYVRTTFRGMGAYSLESKHIYMVLLRTSEGIWKHAPRKKFFENYEF